MGENGVSQNEKSARRQLGSQEIALRGGYGTPNFMNVQKSLSNYGKTMIERIVGGVEQVFRTFFDV